MLFVHEIPRKVLFLYFWPLHSRDITQKTTEFLVICMCECDSSLCPLQTRFPEAGARSALFAIESPGSTAGPCTEL